ncbi:hypothetical protein BDD43_2428 [Mucilaginibacter gracilis]|uniref:Dolichyl-phosphate-mannose-protein mannosyltransferase n=1 Tax=Mucilaginibacter gracilis TaxID=423350 RepID=A0A495J0L3_9SPHI|nr:hypothetical protein [Mucilaginibacter gracilis]RKR82252.1 hypothetical protein BDD43_2428 [Mucilaginibacter gracilis]
MDKEINKQFSYFIIVSGFVAWVVWVLSNQFSSMLDGDAMFFLPQIVSYANGHGLRNVYYLHTISYSPFHDGRYIWHGFLFQVIFGRILPVSTYTKLASVCSILNVFSILLLALSVRKHIAALPTKLGALVLFLILLTAGGFLIGLQGRPETLSTLLFSCGLYAVSIKNQNIQSIILGILLGFALVTSPVPAVLVGLIVLTFWIVQFEISLRLIYNCLIALIGFALAVTIAFIFYPYKLNELISGIIQHRNTLHSINFTENWRSWFIYTGHFFIMGILITAFVTGSVFIRLCFSKMILKVLAVCGVIGILICILYFSSVSGWYVVGSMVPVLIMIIIVFLKQNHISNRKNNFALTIVLLIFAISSLDIILISCARLTGYSGLSLNEARLSLSRDIPSRSGIAFSKSLFILTENTNNNQVMAYEEYDMGNLLKTELPYAVIQQSHEGRDSPPIYLNYDLYINRFTHSKIAKGRLGQWFQPAGFGYAVYRKHIIIGNKK